MNEEKEALISSSSSYYQSYQQKSEDLSPKFENSATKKRRIGFFSLVSSERKSEL